ncbi:MAG: hypothetical protein AAGA29_04930 [Planctomycetota bacterium]
MSDPRPTIRITADESRVADEVIAALAERDKALHHKRGKLWSATHSGDGWSIAEVAPANLRERITRHVRLVQIDSNATAVRVHPPKWLVPAIMARESWLELPHLDTLDRSDGRRG